MPWCWKFGLTTMGLLLVMAAARLGGRRLAGVLAALPMVTAPTLAWTAWEQGTTFAVHAAIASVVSCAGLAAFAWAYARSSRRCTAPAAMACSLVVAAVVMLPAQQASQTLSTALLLALVFTWLAWTGLPARCDTSVGALHASRPSLLVALAIAALTVLAASLGPALGPFATGLLASLPLVSGPIAMAEHASSGHHASTEFLRGYVRGLFGKAAFGALFALLAPAIGVLPALALGAAAACASELRLALVGVTGRRLHSPSR